ncbi:MAG: FAD-dependent oxidoreductase [Erysipelotrichaceae bacterium]|nr:FAD-dependent oxidoreductase [Erysipelotrichaceae bacterium]
MKMKKITGILLSAAVICTALTGCAQQSAETAPVQEETGVKDGTYEAVGTGFSNADVPVSITVEGGRITACTVDGSTQSDGYGKDAADALAQEVVDGQTYDIDVVSGATATRNAVSDAVKQCMEEAGFDVEALAAVQEAGESEEITTDILVIGMGASGSVAALKAAESGAKVLGVEATEMLGGFGNAAQGMFAVGSVEQKARYGEDGETTDDEYWYDHFQERNNNLGNSKLIRTFISEARNTVSYMLNHGVGFFLSEQPQQIAHFDTETVYHRWNNADPFTYIGKGLDEAGVEIRYGTTATELITDENGAVTGAKCTKPDGGELTVHAKAVIVSTGSFAGNKQLMAETLGEEVYANSMVLAGAELPGIEMMWDAGASKGELLTMNHGIAVIGADVETVDQLTLNTPILWVNNQGKRFMNEDLLKDTVEFSSAVLAQGGTAYTIVDEATVERWTDETQENTGTWVHYWDRFGIVDENGNPTIYHAPVSRDTWDSDFASLSAGGQGGVFETLEEAAAFIGCDPADLEETVTNYNTYVKNGYDEEYFKSAESLVYTVEEGPYYVTKGHTCVLGALGGVNTNEKLQVLTQGFEVIDGLYATGNNVSGISYGAYQDVEGVGLGFSLTSGRLAGAAAAEYCGYTPEADTTELNETGEAAMLEATERGMNGNLDN